MITLCEGNSLEVLRRLADAQAPDAPGRPQCCVTSPPFFCLRNYGIAPSVWNGDSECQHVWGSLIPQDSRHCYTESNSGKEGTVAKEGGYPQTRGAFCQRCSAWRGCLGLEPTPSLFIAHLVQIFAQVRRVIRPDASVWINIADSYAGTGKSGGGIQGEKWEVSGAPYTGPRGGKWRPPPEGIRQKSLMLIPQRLAIALSDDGWVIRQVFPWIQRACMPGSQQDRATSALQWWIQCTVRPRYYSDMEAVRQPYSAAGLNDAAHGYGWKADGHTYAAIQQGIRGGGGLNDPAVTRDKMYQHSGRTYRNTDLWMQSLTAPYGLVGVGDELVGLDCTAQGRQDGHYATFAPELILPLVQQSASAYGACGVCGSPYQRIVTRQSQPHPPQPQDHLPPDGRRINGTRGNRLANVGQYTQGHATTGWTPTCSHDAPRIPCTILDPFSGRGTTMLVAQRLGLHGIGIDMNPDDLEWTRKRLEAEAPLLAAVQHGGI